MSSSQRPTGCPGLTTSDSWARSVTSHRRSSNRCTISSNSPASSRPDPTNTVSGKPGVVQFLCEVLLRNVCKRGLYRGGGHILVWYQRAVVRERSPELLVHTLLADFDLKSSFLKVQRGKAQCCANAVGKHNPCLAISCKLAFLRGVELVGLKQGPLPHFWWANSRHALDATRVIPKLFVIRFGAVKHPPPHRFFLAPMKVDEIGKCGGDRVIPLAQMFNSCLSSEHLTRQFLIARIGGFGRGIPGGRRRVRDLVFSGERSEPSKKVCG